MCFNEYAAFTEELFDKVVTDWNEFEQLSKLEKFNHFQ